MMWVSMLIKEVGSWKQGAEITDITKTSTDNSSIVSIY